MTKTTLSLAAAAAILMAGSTAMAQMSGAPSQPGQNPATMGDTSQSSDPGPGHLGYKPKPKTQPGDVKSKKSKTSSATEQGADTSATASGGANTPAASAGATAGTSASATTSQTPAATPPNEAATTPH